LLSILDEISWSTEASGGFDMTDDIFAVNSSTLSGENIINPKFSNSCIAVELEHITGLHIIPASKGGMPNPSANDG
jgi:hypothetical protein